MREGVCPLVNYSSDEQERGIGSSSLSSLHESCLCKNAALCSVWVNLGGHCALILCVLASFIFVFSFTIG